MIRELVRLRDRNQITLPSNIAEQLSAEPGCLLEFVMDTDTGQVEVHRAQVVRAGTPQAKRALQRAREEIKEGRFADFANPQELLEDVEKTRQAMNRSPADAEAVDIEQEFEAVRNRL